VRKVAGEAREEEAVEEIPREVAGEAPRQAEGDKSGRILKQKFS
jgi:hypothetical protein